MDRDHSWRVGVSMRNILLLDSDASSIGKGMAVKESLLVEKKQKEISLLTLNCVPGNLVQHTHTILTPALLQYFSGCFILAFLEGCHPSSSSKLASSVFCSIVLQAYWHCVVRY